MEIKSKFTKINIDSTMEPVTTISNRYGSVRFTSKTERFM